MKRHMTYEGFVDLKHRPSRKDLICDFYFEPNKVSSKHAAGAIAAESSIGTWTTDLSTAKSYMLNLAATVYSLKKHKSGFMAKVAYPHELFDYDNVPDILSSVAGNIFGMKELNNLKLMDITFHNKVLRYYRGPRFGIKKIRKILDVKERPLVGTIIKPKIGLHSKDHAKVAYDAWIGGCDIVKDDENLTDQMFNRFDKRLRLTLKAKRKAEKETGEKKVYMINVTAETKEMLRKARSVADSGNEYLMVDILTVGWSSLQTLRYENDKLKLVMHGHRAMHGALTKNPRHGISMKVIAKISRMIGLDQLHIGTGIGKMYEDLEDVRDNIEACKGKMLNFKKTFPVCSGGLHPGYVPFLVKNLGNDIIIQMGGGIHGNKLGTVKGAVAARQAIDATTKGISLKEYAKKHIELKTALEQWG